MVKLIFHFRKLSVGFTQPLSYNLGELQNDFDAKLSFLFDQLEEVRAEKPDEGAFRSAYCSRRTR